MGVDERFLVSIASVPCSGINLDLPSVEIRVFPGAKTTERESWRRAGCASTSEQYVGQGLGPDRSWRHSARQTARNAAGFSSPGSSMPDCQGVGATPTSPDAPRAHKGRPTARRASGVASSSSSPALGGQTRYRRIGAQIVASAMELRGVLTSQNRFVSGNPLNQE